MNSVVFLQSNCQDLEKYRYISFFGFASLNCFHGIFFEENFAYEL